MQNQLTTYLRAGYPGLAVISSEEARAEAEIAAACGYADLPHMNRAFQKAYGDSPGALRARG